MNDPATKYADRVSPIHQAAMDSIGLAAQLLGQHRDQFERILKSKDYMDNVGGLLDPTLYRDMLQSKSFAHQLSLIRATITFLDEIDKVRNDL